MTHNRKNQHKIASQSEKKKMYDRTARNADNQHVFKLRDQAVINFSYKLLEIHDKRK